jgi:hypothetical protein
MKIFGYAVLMFSIAAAPVFAAEISIPKNAKSSGDLSESSHWMWSHDAKTPGGAVASSHYPIGSPSLDGHAREFSMSYSHKGGERFSLTFAHNAEVTHFVYDTWVYLNNASELANLEMDMNQVIPNGKTMIYAFQCSGNTGHWEYSVIVHNSPHWKSTGVACSPTNWASKKWHHIQIASHRSGEEVTYDGVSFDGDYHPLHDGGPGALSLHWSAGDLNLNFQLDGSEERGEVTIYQDRLTIFYW